MAQFKQQTLDVKKIDGGINDNVTAELIDDDQWSYARNVYGVAGSIMTRGGRRRMSVESISIDSYTKLLLHCDGSDTSTTFTDSSLAARGNATVAGNAQVDTAQSKFGGASLLLDGTGDYLTYADHADWAFGSGDFTVDLWARFSDITTNTTRMMVGQWNGTTNQRGWGLEWIQSTGKLTFIYSTNGTAASAKDVSWTPTLNTWHHIEVSRSGTYLYFFVDGVLKETAKDLSGATFYDSSEVLAIGSVNTSSSATSFFIGHLDEIRISKGIARNTSAFTVHSYAYLDYALSDVKCVGQIQSGTNNYNFAAWNHQLFKLNGVTPGNLSSVRIKDNFNTSGGFGFPLVGFFNFTSVKNAVLCNGIQTPVRWDGTSAGVVNLSGSAPATSDQFINYDNYGLLYDFDALKVYRSNLNDANAGYGSNTPYVIPTKERGDIGSGMCQFGDELIVTTRRSVQKFIKTGVSSSPFTRKEVTSHVGNVAPRGMIVMDNGILFTDYTGIYFYDGALLSRASKPISGTWDEVNKEYLHGICAVNYKQKNWVVFAVPYGSGQTTNNLFLVYDYLESTPGNGKFVWWMFDNSTAQSMGIFRNSSLVDEWWTGNNSGVISLQDSGTSDEGSAFSQYAYGKAFDFKKPNIDKRLHQSRYLTDASGNWDLEVSMDIDMSDASAYSTALSLYNPGSLWGSMIWGVDRWATAGTLQRRKKFPSTVRGRFIQHRFSLLGKDEFFRLYRYMPSVSYKNLRGRDVYA